MRSFEASPVKTDEKFFSRFLMLQEATKRTQDASPGANLKELKVPLTDGSLRDRHNTLLSATELSIIQNIVRKLHMQVENKRHECKSE